MEDVEIGKARRDCAPPFHDRFDVLLPRALMISSLGFRSKSRVGFASRADYCSVTSPHLNLQAPEEAESRCMIGRLPKMRYKSCHACEVCTGAEIAEQLYSVDADSM